jgi:hypothetical protein
MDYTRLVEEIPVIKRELLLNRLVDVILSSKNAEKLPSALASTILYHWQKDILISEAGLTALLEAATLIEPDKTVEVFTQLEMVGFSEHIKQAAAKI